MPDARDAVFPKRFYKDVAIAPEAAGGFVLTLDGKPARTPARSPLALPTMQLAEAVATEWAAVEREIDPRQMPVTRLCNSVIDGVRPNAAEVTAEIIRYAGSDLLAYRAEEPDDLVAAQNAAWDPVVEWVREAFGARLALAAGVMFTPQADEALGRLRQAVDATVGIGPARPFRLGALHVMTTLTGSTLLALAVAAGRLDAAQAWAAAHVDEDHQIAQWGEDHEARLRRDGRWIEMRTAAEVFAQAGG